MIRVGQAIRAAGRAFTSKQLVLGGALVSAGFVVEYGAQMIRMLVLARLLAPAEVGIVVSLNALYALVGMSTSLGVEVFLIHVRGGDRRNWLAVSHTLSLAQAALGAALLLLLAWPTTWLLATPDALGTFLALAVVPVLAGSSHMRNLQLTRRQVFWPAALAATVGNLGGLLVSIGAAFVLRDSRALIWGLCATSALKSIMTHLLTRVEYRLSFNKNELRQALGFGLPLMLNGLMLALLGQLDRILVGAFLGVEPLGSYGLAMTLILTPISLLLRVGTVIFQPRLSAAWHSAVVTAFPSLFRQTTMVFALLGGVYSLCIATTGGIVLPIMFGTRFAVGAAFMAVLAGISLVRFAKGIANLGGVATGRTMDVMFSNAAGALGLLVAMVGLSLRPTLNVAAVSYLSGELLGTLLMVARLDRLFRLHEEGCPFRAFLVAAAVLISAIAWVALADPPLSSRVAFATALVVLASILGWRFASPLRGAARIKEN